MKKILKKLGSGLSKLRNTKAKIIITAILTVIMLVDVNPFFLKAGRETLVYTFKDGIQHPYAFDNNHNSYSYYAISWMGGHVAYCMDYDVKNPPNGTGLQYIGNVKSNKVVAVLMNGYPAKSASQLGLPNNEEAYLATQMAVWSAVNGTSDTKGLNFDINKLQPNLKYSQYTSEMVTNGKKVAKQLLSKSYNPGTFALDSSSSKVNYEYSNSQIKIGPYKVNVTGYSSLNKVKVTLSGQPAGTKIVDKNNKEKSSFAKNEEIYVLVNKSLPAGSLKLTATGTANKYVGVIYGKGSWQNFVFLDTEQVDVSGSATASWKESKGNIAVVKSDQDKKPVQGAEFSLLDSNGKQVATGKTDANGNLNFDKLDLGNYTLIESSVPDGYIIEKASYNITVKRNQTTKVEVKNTKVKGVLQITKIEKTAKTPIAGAVFEIYDANNKVVAKITSNENGIATSPELEKGSYTYKEVSVPDGYIMDTQVKNFSITEKNSVIRETKTNEKIVGKLQLIKIGDDGEKPLEGAEFEIYDVNKKVVAKLVTDKNGKASSPDLGKGTYTYKEVKAPEGYDIDPKEYTFKIETQNQIVEQSMVDKKIYGVINIIKVDENDKPIEGVKFQILDSNNKVVATVTTDANGKASVQNLTVGKYKYKEIDTPYLYVLDEKEHEFEITSESREANARIVNQRAKGILKIIKLDKETKQPVSKVKFNIIEKSSDKVVDTITTDENGIARTKALPTGEYFYQEIEVPPEYVLDNKKYEFKIKKNNEMLEKKVKNIQVRGKLKIIKVDENDSPIEGVKFQILNSENKNVGTIKTDSAGTATLDNLKLGNYKYKEIDVPDEYVLDTNEYDFEINAKNLEASVKVVNKRSHGNIKIIKFDKDSKVAIANAKFNVIDKSNNDIVDAIVTDENGIATTKALPTGEYIYQEVEVPDEYIIDNKTYDVKIKKNNETVEKKVSNEHKKLPVTGGFLSTDALIVIIVTAGSTIAYILYKIIKNKNNNEGPTPTDDGNSTGTQNNFNNPNDNNGNLNDISNTQEKSEVNNNLTSENIINNDDKSLNEKDLDININKKENEESITKENKVHLDNSNSIDENLIIKNNDEDMESSTDLDLNNDNSDGRIEDLEDEMLDFTPKYNNEENTNKED